MRTATATPETAALDRREAWLKERKSGIGGSDAAAILGLSPWRTAVDVWLEKTGRKGDEPETEAMRIGTELEDFVARRYSQETGRTVQRYNKMIHKGCLLGNFDRLVVPDGEKVASHMGEVRTDTVLECKTSSREWDGEVPLYYQTQVQHYMGLEPKLLHADVAVLFLGRKHFEVFRVERDDEVIGEMTARLSAWWTKYVEGGEMPPPSNEDDCRLLWARSNPGKTVEATAETLDILKRYALAKEAEDNAKALVSELRSGICAAMGDAEALVDSAGKPLATWKSAKDSGKTDWEALARWMYANNHVNTMLPLDWIARFTSEKPGARRFTVKLPA